jgi:oxygen-independent coproporphyrinogen-3 oxidase
LEQVVNTGVSHVSVYILEIDEDSRLGRELIAGGTRYHAHFVPNDDMTASFYEDACATLDAAGIPQYEISNFARLELEPYKGMGSAPSRFRSRHNMKYWTGAPFFGMGCGAHSYDGQARWVNILKTESYIAAINKNGEAIAERHALSAGDRAAEALFMQLRLNEGVALETFRDEYGLDVLARFGDELPRLTDADLIQIRDGRIMLTDKGRLLSNEVFVSLI